MKQYILLDWDGNLAKTLDVWLHVTRVLLEKRGLGHLSDEEIATSFGIPVERYAQWGITDVDTAITEMDSLAAKMLPEVELYPDALEVLESLKKKGKQTALITSSLRRNVVPLLDKYHIRQYFDVVVTYEDTQKHKPDGEPLEKALAELGGTKEQAIMIGDSDKDLGAANSAGVDSILFYPDEHQKFYALAELQKLRPTHVVNDFREILDIV